MKQKLQLIALGFLVCFGFVNKSYAACGTINSSFNNSNPMVLTSSTNNTMQSITISRSGSNLSTCNYFVTVQDSIPRSLTSGSNSVPFYILVSLNGASVAPYSTASTGTVLTMTFSGNSTTATLQFVPKVDLSSAFNTGTYNGAFDFNIYSGSNYSSGQSPVKTINNYGFRYQISSYAHLSLVNVGGGFSASSTSRNMTFNPMVSNDFQEFDVVVRYTDGYRLTMTSSVGNNSGAGNRLKHSTGNYFVPYTMRVGGTNYIIGTSTNVSENSGNNGDGHTDGNGNGNGNDTDTSIRVRVTLQTVPTNIPTGTYTDTIMLVVAAI